MTRTGAVLGEGRAAWLARRAGRPGADGRRSLLARQAWRILTEAGGRGDEAAIEAVWQAWLDDPDDERWQVLTRWREPQALAAAAFTAAVEPGCDAARREAIGVFCAARRMAPEDPAERALFLVLTGQGVQHRAADPDGSLIAAAYLAAGPATRSALRQATTHSGDLDLAHVIADRRDRAGPLTREERHFLVRNLADEGDWERLWRLILDLPLTDAVACVRQVGGGWRPDRDADRALFDRLTRASPEEIAAARGGLDEPGVVRIEIDDVPTHGAFSPDGRWLLVATSRGGRYSGCRVFELPSGRLAERVDHDGDIPPAGVLHLGHCYVVVGRVRDNPLHRRYPASRAWELVRYTGGQADIPHWSREPMAVAATPGGFVAMEAQWGPPALRLQFGDVACNVVPGGTLSGPFFGLGSWPGMEPRVAADPRGERLALATWGLAVIDLPAARVLAFRPARDAGVRAGDLIDEVCFPAPDRVATVGRTGRILLYRLAGDRLEVRARVGVSSAPRPGLVPVSGRREIAVIDEKLGLRYLDAETLADVAAPRELAGRSGSVLFGSVDGRHHALCGSRDGAGFADVLWTGPAQVAALARRPMAAMKREDLAAVTARLRDLGPGAAARPFLDLLARCLEHRYAADIGIGSAAGPSDGAYDVALSAEDDRPC